MKKYKIVLDEIMFCIFRLLTFKNEKKIHFKMKELKKIVIWNSESIVIQMLIKKGI